MLLGREKRIEDTFVVDRINSTSRILYNDFQILVIYPTGKDRQFSFSSVDGAHCLNCIHDEIQENLLKLYALAYHQRKLARQFISKGNVF